MPIYQSARRFVGMRGVFAIGLAAAAGAAYAQGPQWRVVASGNARIAKIALSGAISGVGMTCDGARPAFALNLTRMPARSPAQLSLRIGSATAELRIFRNGATNVWIAYVTDSHVLDKLAEETRFDVAIDGAPYGSVSLDGAAAAMRDALGGCYRAAPVSPAGRAPAPVAPAEAGIADPVAAAVPLASAILAIAPAPGAKPTTVASALQRVPSLRRGGTYDFSLGELDVMASNGSKPTAALEQIDFSNAPVTPGSTRLRSRLYDPVAALRGQGATLRPILCTLNEGNRDEWFAVSAPGKAPFHIEVVNWPPKRAGENYVLSVRVWYSRAPTAAALMAGMEEKPRRCPA